MYIALGMLAGLLVFALIMASAIGKIYNRLVSMSNQTKNGFKQISVQLQRRYDLIPNLVESVRGYMTHESATLEAVIQARNQASAQLQNAAANPGNGAAMASLASADGLLTGAMGKLSFVMEDYPELKANEVVADLTEELTSTENRIAFARQSYNDWATAFNIRRQSFPAVVFAGTLGFNDDFDLLEFEDQKIQEAPQVSLV